MRQVEMGARLLTVRVIVQEVGIALALFGAQLELGFVCALDVEMYDDCVFVGAWVGLDAFRLLVPPFEPFQPLLAALERNEAEPVCEHFVLDDGSILVDEDVFNGEGRDVG